MLRKWVCSGLFYLLVISFLGIILRYKTLSPILPGLQFSNLVHAHSHVAFLGWVFFILAGILIKHALPAQRHNSKQIHIFFYLIHVSVLGMLVSFSLQGYALFSIAFSTVHVFISYYLAFIFFKYGKSDLPWIVTQFFRAGIIFNALSSIGPWGLALGGAFGLNTPSVANTFIYLYLHLQYNGWFTFIILGTLLLKLIEKGALAEQAPRLKWPFRILAISVLPSYVTSIFWLDLHPMLILLGIAGAVLQLAGISLLISNLAGTLLRPEREKDLQALLGLALLSLMAKSVLEAVGSWPSIAPHIYDSRQVIIAYLHLALLGFVSSILLYYLTSMESSRKSKWRSVSITAYIIGTVLMILLLFVAGLLQWITIPIPHSLWLVLTLASAMVIFGIMGLIPSLIRRNS